MSLLRNTVSNTRLTCTNLLILISYISAAKDATFSCTLKDTNKNAQTATFRARTSTTIPRHFFRFRGGAYINTKNPSFPTGTNNAPSTDCIDAAPESPPPPPPKTLNSREEKKSSIHSRSTLRMYCTCTAIVSAWVALGTLFYSRINHWPIPQSFFYAIDAGMSIGFCTDVIETSDTSRIFTIAYVLAFASVIGGALVLFVEDVYDGVAQASRGEYVRLLEREAFRHANESGSGVLSYEEFQLLPALQQQQQQGGEDGLSEDEMRRVWKMFDRLNDGVVHLNREFIGRYRNIDDMVKDAKKQGRPQDNTKSIIHAAVNALRSKVEFLWISEHRIYVAFILWLLLGVTWGMIDQHWTPITALHFAVSACTTGGLTAPPVNEDGILPTFPSLFCGCYCLFGIPLFAVTLGHFTTALVAEHVVAAESNAIARPMTTAEFEFAKQLCTDGDNVVHLSDFIVFQLLRQGKIDIEMVKALKRGFRAMDLDDSGVLTLEQATSSTINTNVTTSGPFFN